MIKPDHRVTKIMALISRQHPEFLEWLAGWRAHELEQLPHAIEHTALKQGRCQVLGELHKFVKEAPEIAAKLHL
jgi:hypothetical protein